MAGVSAACIAPPLATGVAVLLKPKAYSKDERSAGYVNFLLGSTHITEGAIPFAAKNPLLNIPIFMIGSSVAAVLSYVSKIQVPAPHGGFIILPLVNHPILWFVYILIGALISGVLLAFVAEHSAKKHGVSDSITNSIFGEEETQESPSNSAKNTLESFSRDSSLDDILSIENIIFDVQAKTKDDVLRYLAQISVEHGIATNKEQVYQKYVKREEEGSTGMEKGIAIPHAQDISIKESKMLVIRLTSPVQWLTFDNKPVDTIISFVIPETDKGTHLKYLSNTAKLLMHDDFVDKLKQVETPNEMKNLFTKSVKVDE